MDDEQQEEEILVKFDEFGIRWIDPNDEKEAVAILVESARKREKQTSR